MIAEVKLEAELVNSLRETAEQEGLTPERVIDTLVRHYIRQARRKKIEEECQYYEAIHGELKSKYLGQHVAIHEGELVDHDIDPLTLVRRIRARYGRTPVLITQVREQPITEYVIRGPRLTASQ